MKIRTLAILFAGASLSAEAIAETASYGFRLSHVRWRERGQVEDRSVSANGPMFGPTLLFRVDEDDRWSIGVDGAYGSMNELQRAEVDLSLGYHLGDIFTLFATARYLEYDFEEDDTEFDADGFGLGPGIAVTAPIGQSGVFVFANTRVLVMSLSTDKEEDSPFLWGYEGGLAYGAPVDLGVNETSIYFALGFRYSRMKGDEVDETMKVPFVEFGIKQEF